MTMKNFAIIGAAGYIAPRHLKAIASTGNNLVAAYDPFDSVGILDSYFPNADFFSEFERFDRHIEKGNRHGESIDFVSICSPNYLHDAHIRFALRNNADAICEKPLVLNPWNADLLEEVQNETGRRIYTILQLRLHPTIIALRDKIQNGPAGKVYDIDLTYITSRGHWYYSSWKGDESKSGGISSNIGIHFFDMLLWIFGDMIGYEVYANSHDRASGYLELKNARIRWFLSINSDHLPTEISKKGQTTYRSIEIDSEELEFSVGFEDLHTQSYKNILDGKGFGIEEARASIDLVHNVRTCEITTGNEKEHPYMKNPKSKHPFIG